MNTTAEIFIDRDLDPRDKVQIAVLSVELQEVRQMVHITATLKTRRPSARQQQHGYYRTVVLPLARMWLNETQGGMDNGEGGFRDYTPDEAHVWLKQQTIGVPVANPKSGEQIGIIVPSCGQMTTMQMFHFTELVVDLLMSFEVRVPPPDKNWREAKALAAGRTG